MGCNRLILALALFPTSTLWAAEKLPAELALIPKDAGLFISVRYDLLNQTSLGKAPVFGEGQQPDLVKSLGFPITEAERITLFYPMVPKRLIMSSMPLFVVTRNKPIDREATVRKLNAKPILRDRDDERDTAGDFPIRRGDFYDLRDAAIYFVGERSVLAVNSRSAGHVFAMLGQLIDPSTESPLSNAILAAEKNVLVAGASGAGIRTILESWPHRAKDLAPLGEASSISLVASSGSECRLSLEARFPDEKKAQAGLKALVAIRKWATENLEQLVADRSKEYAEIAELLLLTLRSASEPTLVGSTVSVQSKMKAEELPRILTAGLQALLERIRNEGFKLRQSNNLKMIGLGMHNIADAYGELLLKERPKDGLHPGLSWRVQLLPHVEEDQLFRQFRTNEPWDSDHNKRLIEKMPKVFAPPPGAMAKAGHTFYRMFDGPGTLYRMKAFANVTDGLSNTLMAVEAGEPVIWTKPDEIEYDPKKPMPKLGGHFPDGFNVLFADGSVRFVNRDVDEKLLRAWITANGGEEIPKEKK